MALITFNCAWLTWPRLASRQAGPKSRKISATSRAGRSTNRQLLWCVLVYQREQIERACNAAEHLGGRMGPGARPAGPAIQTPAYTPSLNFCAEGDLLAGAMLH